MIDMFKDSIDTILRLLPWYTSRFTLSREQISVKSGPGIYFDLNGLVYDCGEEYSYRHH